MTQASSSTRNALLQAAEALFSQRGFDAVGIREIAQQAGVNLASINYHFGSKHDLYIETVRDAMGRHGAAAIWEVLDPPATGREDAAMQLARFIRIFFKARIEGHAQMDACSLLMIREALQPSDAIDAVVHDYIRPKTDLLIATLRAIDPTASPRRLERYSELVFGHLLYYRICGPFVERLSDIELSTSHASAELAHEAARFSLRGLGCDEALIGNVMKCLQSEEAVFQDALDR